MSASGFRFEANQPYQLEAIASVVDLFDGQPQDAEHRLEDRSSDSSQGAWYSRDGGSLSSVLCSDELHTMARLSCHRVQHRLLSPQRSAAALRHRPTEQSAMGRLR